MSAVAASVRGVPAPADPADLPTAPGTARVRAPEETWEIVRPRLRHYGITRVAELTGLDVIGLPVYMAVRPLATTVGVSQGKGLTPLLARLSAVMEAIEICVVERFRPAPRRHRALDLDLAYSPAELTHLERSLACDHTPLDWVEADSLAGGGRTFVPVRAVALDGLADGRWQPRTLVASSNGLASGNTLAEATLHALFEVAERHSIATLGGTPIEDRRVLDLGTIPGGWCREFIDRLRAEEFWFEVVDCSTLPGTYAFAAFLWRSDMPSPYGGSGCHISPMVALYRAVTEAVQSRMSVISGLREDLGPTTFPGVRRPAPPRRVEPNHAWPGAAPAGRAAGPAGTTPEAVTARLADAIGAVTRRPVLRVDLTPPGEAFAVCKVLAPGLDFDVYRQLPRDLPRRLS